MRFQNGSNKVVIELRVVQFWSEIILVISNRTRAARSFDVEITRMISDQIALHSAQLPLWTLEDKFHLFHTYWDFRIKFCVMKMRFGFYFDQSERRNEFLTREKIVSSNHKPRFKWIVFSRAFSRSSWVALLGSFDKILYFRCTQVFVIQTSKLSRARRYFWGWLNNQEDLCL